MITRNAIVLSIAGLIALGCGDSKTQSESAVSTNDALNDASLTPVEAQDAEGTEEDSGAEDVISPPIDADVIWEGVCGDGECDADETAESCNDDCPSVCGDTLCTAGETAENCNDCVGANACQDDGDLTSQSFPHFGNGQDLPYNSDQSWLSAAEVTDDCGWHNSGSSPVPAYAAIVFPAPTTVTQLRLLLRSDGPQNVSFQGSNNTTNGEDGDWTTLLGPMDTSGDPQVEHWVEWAFDNDEAFTFYRLMDDSGIGFVVCRWEMLPCGGP